MTEIQSQDIEKQRHATQGAPRPTEGQTQPHDRPPGQPHDPPPQTGQDDKVEREPSHDSRSTQDPGRANSQQQKRRR